MLRATWERERRLRVSLADLRGVVGSSAVNVAKRMAQKGVLERVGRGIYIVRPLRSLPRRALPSAPVLLSQLLVGKPHYLGGLWALTFHRLTTRQYTSVIDVFVNNRLRPRPLASTRVVFHRRIDGMFRDGVIEAPIEDTPVRVSTAERTIIDLLDYPDTVGGIRTAVAIARETVPKVDAALLLAQVLRVARRSTAQRLGVLLERAGVPRRRLEPLEKHLGQGASRLLMVPSGARTGALNERWSVV